MKMFVGNSWQPYDESILIARGLTQSDLHFKLCRPELENSSGVESVVNESDDLKTLLGERFSILKINSTWDNTEYVRVYLKISLKG